MRGDRNSNAANGFVSPTALHSESKELASASLVRSGGKTLKKGSATAVLRGRTRVLAEVQNGPQLRELRLKQKNPIGGFVHRSGFPFKAYVGRQLFGISLPIPKLDSMLLKMVGRSVGPPFSVGQSPPGPSSE
jgi:hypothetical protein